MGRRARGGGGGLIRSSPKDAERLGAHSDAERRNEKGEGLWSRNEPIRCGVGRDSCVTMDSGVSIHGTHS